MSWQLVCGVQPLPTHTFSGVWRWPLVMLAYMTALAYAASLIVYRLAVSAGLG